jgi:hypothetical protein
MSPAEHLQRAVVGARASSPAEQAAFSALTSFAATIGISRTLNYVRERRRPFPRLRSLTRRMSSGPHESGARVHHFLPGLAIALATGATGILSHRRGSWLGLPSAPASPSRSTSSRCSSGATIRTGVISASPSAKARQPPARRPHWRRASIVTERPTSSAEDAPAGPAARSAAHGSHRIDGLAKTWLHRQRRRPHLAGGARSVMARDRVEERRACPRRTGTLPCVWRASEQSPS